MAQPNPSVQLYQNPPAFPMAPGPYGIMDYPTPIKKSPTLGVVGLALVVLAGIGTLIAMLKLMAAYVAIMVQTYGPNMSNWNTSNPRFTEAQIATLNSPTLFVVLAGLVGLSGLVVSIVATATNRGRIFGILGIIFGVVLPFVLTFVAAMIAIAPHA
jgi:hypothetical protein